MFCRLFEESQACFYRILVPVYLFNESCRSESYLLHRSIFFIHYFFFYLVLFSGFHFHGGRAVINNIICMYRRVHYDAVQVTFEIIIIVSRHIFKRLMNSRYVIANGLTTVLYRRTKERSF